MILKVSAINNYTGATEVNWNSPRQTGSYYHPNYKPRGPPCLSSTNWSVAEN